MRKKRSKQLSLLSVHILKEVMIVQNHQADVWHIEDRNHYSVKRDICPTYFPAYGVAREWAEREGFTIIKTRDLYYAGRN